MDCTYLQPMDPKLRSKLKCAWRTLDDAVKESSSEESFEDATLPDRIQSDPSKREKEKRRLERKRKIVKSIASDPSKLVSSRGTELREFENGLYRFSHHSVRHKTDVYRCCLLRACNGSFQVFSDGRMEMRRPCTHPVDPALIQNRKAVQMGMKAHLDGGTAEECLSIVMANMPDVSLMPSGESISNKSWRTNDTASDSDEDDKDDVNCDLPLKAFGDDVVVKQEPIDEDLTVPAAKQLFLRSASTAIGVDVKVEVDEQSCGPTQTSTSSIFAVDRPTFLNPSEEDHTYSKKRIDSGPTVDRYGGLTEREWKESIAAKRRLERKRRIAQKLSEYPDHLVSCRGNLLFEYKGNLYRRGHLLHSRMATSYRCNTFRRCPGAIYVHDDGTVEPRKDCNHPINPILVQKKRALQMGIKAKLDGNSTNESLKVVHENMPELLHEHLPSGESIRRTMNRLVGGLPKNGIIGDDGNAEDYYKLLARGRRFRNIFKEIVAQPTSSRNETETKMRRTKKAERGDREDETEEESDEQGDEEEGNEEEDEEKDDEEGEKEEEDVHVKEETMDTDVSFGESLLSITQREHNYARILSNSPGPADSVEGHQRFCYSTDLRAPKTEIDESLEPRNSQNKQSDRSKDDDPVKYSNEETSPKKLEKATPQRRAKKLYIDAINNNPDKIVSCRGRDLLEYGNNLWRCSHPVKLTGAMTYRCNTVRNCSGHLHVLSNGQIELRKACQHPLDADLIQKKRAMQFGVKARLDGLSPSESLEVVRANLPTIDGDPPAGFSEKSVKKAIRHVVGAVEKPPKDIVVEDIWADSELADTDVKFVDTTVDRCQMRLGIPEDEDLVVFCTPVGKELLETCNQWTLDRYTKVAPIGFHEIVVIGVMDEGTFRACVYAFDTSPINEMYRAIWTEVDRRLTRLPSNLVFNCEMDEGIVAIFSSVFSRASISYDFFRFKESLWRGLQRHGLVPLCNTNAQAMGVYKYICTLALIKPGSVRNAFLLLKDDVEQQGLQQMDPWLEHVFENYIGIDPAFSIRLWNRRKDLLELSHLVNVGIDPLSSRALKKRLRRRLRMGTAVKKLLQKGIEERRRPKHATSKLAFRELFDYVSQHRQPDDNGIHEYVRRLAQYVKLPKDVV